MSEQASLKTIRNSFHDGTATILSSVWLPPPHRQVDSTAFAYSSLYLNQDQNELTSSLENHLLVGVVLVASRQNPHGSLDAAILPIPSAQSF